MCERVLSCRENTFGLSNPEYFVDLCTLRYICHETESSIEASELYEKAWSESSFLLDMDHPKVWFVLNRYVRMLLQRLKSSTDTRCTEELSVRLTALLSDAIEKCERSVGSALTVTLKVQELATLLLPG